MAHIFEITASPEQSVKLDTNGAGTVSFTVTNTSAGPVMARTVLLPSDSPAIAWLKLTGESERMIQPKMTDTFVVHIQVPGGTSPGDYRFRMDAVSVARPDEDSTQGPTLSIPVRLGPVPAKPFPWWILVAAALVIAVAAGTAYWLLRDNRPEGPIPIANAGFEDTVQPITELGNLIFSQVVPNSKVAKTGGTLEAWKVVFDGPESGPHVAAGSFSASHEPGAKRVWSGKNFGYLQASVGQTVGLIQTLSATLQPNCTYTLSALAAPLGLSRNDYAIELVAGTTIVASTTTNATFVDRTISTTYAAPSSNVPQGQLQVRFRLKSPESPDSDAQGTAAFFFDDVSLKVVPTK